MKDGEVDFTTGWNGRFYNAKKDGAKVGYTFNPDAAYETFINFDADPSGEVLAVTDDATVMAAALVMYEDAFQFERTGIIVKLYTRVDYRGTYASRMLMKRAIDWFDKKDCIFSEALASGNLPTDQLTLNLYKKFGYSEEGVFLRRKHNGRL
jgi:GNAT superfamily N-acetyltransferase